MHSLPDNDLICYSEFAESVLELFLRNSSCLSCKSSFLPFRSFFYFVSVLFFSSSCISLFSSFSVLIYISVYPFISVGRQGDGGRQEQWAWTLLWVRFQAFTFTIFLYPLFSLSSQDVLWISFSIYYITNLILLRKGSRRIPSLNSFCSLPLLPIKNARPGSEKRRIWWNRRRGRNDEIHTLLLTQSPGLWNQGIGSCFIRIYFRLWPCVLVCLHVLFFLIPLIPF